MTLGQTNELSASARKAAIQAEPEPTTISSDLLYTDGVKHAEGIPTIKDDALIMNRVSSIHSSADSPQQRSYLRSTASSFSTTDDDLTPRHRPPGPEIPSPKHRVAKNPVHSSQNHPKLSLYMPSSLSPPPSMPTLRTRVEARPSPNTTRRTVSKYSAPQPHPRSTATSAPDDDNPPVLKRRKSRRQPSLDTFSVSNPKPRNRISSPLPSAETSTLEVDDDSLDVFEYDLDKDPTEETYVFRNQFYERSPLSALLSARFIHARLSEKIPDLTAVIDELPNGEADPVDEFIEPGAFDSVGPHTPPYVLDSAAVLGNSDPTPAPDYCNLGLEGVALDPFTVPTMDDVINHQLWGSDPEPAIDPSILGNAPLFSPPHPPPPSPRPFRDFHSWKRVRTASPPLIEPALAIQAPPDASRTPREVESDLGGGKAKFYKKGALQIPPHLSNSQRRRTVSAKASESIHISGQLSPSQVASANSPLSEYSAPDFLATGATSTSSLAAPNEATNIVDEDVTVISSGSSSPPRVNRARAAISGKEKNRAGQKGPYRIIAVNELSHCHQCRRATPHPKMQCRACPKLYCISCIVKRYHDIEFHQFREDFDCPSCLDTCNCTICCDKRREVYISSRHVKFDKETMAKLLSGEIRSLPHISASLARPPEKLKPGQDPKSLRRRESLPTVKRKKAPARRKRVSNRWDTSDDDFDKSDSSTASNGGGHIEPTQAAMQTQRMLEESGSGRYWGTVYSISGERIGTSYVGNNLRNVTIEANGFSPSVTDYLPPPSGQWKRRVYVGRWQDAWGFYPEISDGSSSEDERGGSRNARQLGRARFCYIGNQRVIRAWRKAQARKTHGPPAALSQRAGDIDVHVSPAVPPFNKGFDQDEAAEVMLTEGIQNEGEDEDDMGNFWIMEDRSPPKKGELPFLADISWSGPSSAGDVLDVGPKPALESCGQVVTQEDLFKAVASGLQAVGTAVLLPPPPLSPPPLAS